ncbi:exonuclease domain-containing protein [Roseovarius sp.]|uniref:exonuclease domain-containing protein n=1 Tax=Roseovarius sp. TaxID=1486281 RepID=UPI003D09D41D
MPCLATDALSRFSPTYVDPCTSTWAFTGLHGVSQSTVRGAPKFAEALSLLEVPLGGVTIYQHSGFDRSAFRAACALLRRNEPLWIWQNSVIVARRAWPEVKGNGGHGLASLKTHLRLSFEHHDAGEDARAAAEIVLHAEKAKGREICLHGS